MNRNIIRGIVLIFLSLLIFIGDYVIEKRKKENYTNMETQYQCDNCVIYPYKYYIDKLKQLIQFELHEINYSKEESEILLKVYNSNGDEIKSQFIKSSPIKNSYNDINERKYMIQIKEENSLFYRFYLFQNEIEIYHFQIDINDFNEHTLIKKDKNYFMKLENLKKNHSIKEYKEMVDTDFIEHNLLMEDDSYPEENDNGE